MAAFTKIQDAKPLGEYKTTSIDANKKIVDFTVIFTQSGITTDVAKELVISVE